VLGRTNKPEEIKEIMLTPIAGEITEREPIDAYLIFQGGIPEIDDWLKQISKNF
jgi:glutamyl-tRNA(Gln) amidotransferase subunit D